MFSNFIFSLTIIMTKKDYILTLLSHIDNHRDLAWDLRTLIEHTEISDSFIDGLTALLMEAVHEVSDDTAKSKLENSQKFLSALQKKEENENNDIDRELDQMLANI